MFSGVSDPTGSAWKSLHVVGTDKMYCQRGSSEDLGGSYKEKANMN